MAVIQRRKPSALVDHPLLPLPQNPAAEIEDGAKRDRINQLVATLPKEQQTALELAFFQGLNHHEIAKETGASLATVKTRIRVALKTLGRG